MYDSEIRARIKQYQREVVEPLVHERKFSGRSGQKLVSGLYDAFDLTDSEPDDIYHILWGDNTPDLSLRACRVLARLGIRTARDLASLRREDLYIFHNCGKLTIEEIRKKVLLPLGLDYKE